MNQSLRVVLVDDDPPLRFALTKLLDHHGGYEVVGEADNGQQGIEMVVEMQPDIVVLDLMMPTVSGGDALPTLVRRCPRTMVVVLSALGGAADVEALLAGGAFAYHGKSQLTSVPQLLDADYQLFAAALQGYDTVAPWRLAALSDAI